MVVIKGLVLTLVNLFNIAVAAMLLILTVNAYRKYHLRIFKNAWMFIIIASVLWLTGHVFLFLHLSNYIHYVLFTIFIIFVCIGFWLLTKAAETLGGV